MAESWKETWGKLDWEDSSDKKLAQLVKDMVTNGADVNAKNEDGWTALIYAARSGKTETVKALVEAGADVNAKDTNGKTALIGALMEGYAETALALVKAGAVVNAKDNDEEKKKTRAEIRAEIMAHKKAIRMETEAHELAIPSLTSQLSQTTPERGALAKKLKEIRAEYAPDKALDAAANNKTVQELRKRVKDAAER